MSGAVRSSTIGDGRTITLDAPARRNALDGEMWDALARAVERAAGDRPRFLELTGSGTAFCAGGDLKAMKREFSEANGPELFRRRMERCLGALYEFPAPTVARVQGAAVGGGLELALACDIRIVARSATFRMPAVRFGMVMAVPELRRLVSAVGAGWARVIVSTGMRVDADTAGRIGLAHHVVADVDLDETTRRVTSSLASMDPASVQWSLSAIARIAAGRPDEIARDFEVDCLRRPEFWKRIEEVS